MSQSCFARLTSPLSIERRRSYREDEYWTNETFVEVFERAFRDHPDQELVGPNRRVTYAELEEEVQAVATGLHGLGIDQGDVVSFQLPNWVTAAAIHLAVSKIGAIANPITPIYRSSELEFILRDSSSTCLVIPDKYRGTDYPDVLDSIAEGIETLEHTVVVGDTAPRISGVQTGTYNGLQASDSRTTFADVSADDLHVLLYTSGTTGDPKGVLHTHNTFLAEVRQAAGILGLSNETTVFMPSPVGHVTGLCYGIELPFFRGMKAVYMDRWEPETAVDLIKREGCNVTMAATPFLRDLTQAAPDDWQNPLRVFSSGGAEVPPALITEATETLNCKVHRMYGLTELSTVTWPSLDADLSVCAETDGPPAPGVDVKIVDEETREKVPAGESGELLVRGPELMIGYTDQELTDDAFEGEWFKTGDLARIENGYVEITGRLKDVVIRGGETISVKEVEDCLHRHPAIENVAVVAMPDPELGEKGCAYVRVADGHALTFEEMVEHVEGMGIAKQKTPERLEFVEILPETASGKIEKETLRDDIREKLEAESPSSLR